jgi:hypothetical protein
VSDSDRVRVRRELYSDHPAGPVIAEWETSAGILIAGRGRDDDEARRNLRRAIRLASRPPADGRATFEIVELPSGEWAALCFRPGEVVELPAPTPEGAVERARLWLAEVTGDER